MNRLILALTSLLLVTALTSPEISSLDRESGTQGHGLEEDGDSRVRLATTTSLYDTGVWDYLEPIFEERTGVELDVVYAGTGIALEYGRRGDVDVIAVHSRSREEQFVSEGYGIERVPFAYNYFLIVGPEEDPALIKGKSASDALKVLEEKGSAPFVSRGDNSGTHTKELQLWERAGYGGEDRISQFGDWYIESGRGMGPTLLMANEKRAYTLADIGTFLSYRGKIDLVAVVETDPTLLNVYSVIACSPKRNPTVEHKIANALVAFLISPEIQELIGKYGIKEYGRSIFTPCAGAEPGPE